MGVRAVSVAVMLIGSPVNFLCVFSLVSIWMFIFENVEEVCCDETLASRAQTSVLIKL